MERAPNARLLLLLAGCGPWAHLQERLEPDLLPPLLLAVRVRATELELEFDEPPICPAADVRFTPGLAVDGLSVSGNCLHLTCSGQRPGVRYQAEIGVSDSHGNRLELITELYGYNPRVPVLRINEFTTQGSDAHPDLVELRVMGGGELAGVALYQGTAGDWADRLVFPAVAVREGQYILAHFKPQGIAAECDETGDMSASGGLDASDRAFDFWVPGATGLSGNNGVLSVYDRPGGALLDGVLYSNRRSDSDVRYRGFGSAATLARAEELAAAGGWVVSGEAIRPEDAVNPEDSTSTRSLCRSSGSIDTDSAADWHIVPTRGSTFGGENSDERYPTGTP